MEDYAAFSQLYGLDVHSRVIAFCTHILPWQVKGAAPGAAGAAALGELRFGRAQLQPHLQALFTNLFGVMERPDYPENEYLMRCVMRALGVAGGDVAPMAGAFLQKFQATLTKVCRNPANPSFNHYLFESVAALVGSVCAANGQAAVASFEQLLFPPFQRVLQQQVEELSPYVFQIFAQLLELGPGEGGGGGGAAGGRAAGGGAAGAGAAAGGGGVSATYQQLYPPLLSPALWSERGNVPALVRLLHAYLRKGARTVVCAKPGNLTGLLGVCQKLVSSRANEGPFHNTAAAREWPKIVAAA